MEYTTAKAHRPRPAEPVTLFSVRSFTVDRACAVRCTPHAEQAKLLFRTAEGGGVLTDTDGRRISLAPQSLIWLPAAQLAACACETPPWTVRCFAFAADFVPFAEKTDYPVPPSADEAVRLQEIADALLSEAEAGYASAAFAAMLAHWARECHAAAPPRLFTEIEQYIARCPFGTLSVEALAARFGVSDRTLRSLFCQQTGISPKQYIEARQAAAAEELLRDTDLPVREIAALLGFSDPYYFSRFIKKRFRHSPAALRAAAVPPESEGEAAPAAQSADLADTPWLL